MNFIYIFKDGLELGLIWALLALGVFISFRVLDFADLTAEGTITLGSSVIAGFILREQNLILAMAVVTITGFLAGAITGLLNTKLKIPAILSGIISMTALYSINLRVLGSASKSLGGYNNIFTPLRNIINDPFLSKVLTLLLILVVIFFILYLLFGTELGMAIRATGMNEKMAGAQGVNTDLMIILGLGISNAIIALGGALIAQYNNTANLEMGRGTIVVGLASIIIGEVIFGKRSFKNWLISVILGSIVYQLLIGIALELGLNTNDLKLVQAILITIILAIPVIKGWFINEEKLAYDQIK